jgi:hypothetical protein
MGRNCQLSPKTSVHDPGPYEIQLWRSSIYRAQQLEFVDILGSKFTGR